MVGQEVRTRVMASRSADVTQMAYLPFTATCLATYVHRNDLLGGSHVAASPSPLDLLVEESTASRFKGSLASASRLPAGQVAAPFCQASESATRWSMSTSLAPP